MEIFRISRKRGEDQIIENSKNISIIKYFPYWSIGLFFLALCLKTLYYQVHAWPIKADNCLTTPRFCPSNEYLIDKSNDREENDEYNVIEGKILFGSNLIRINYTYSKENLFFLQVLPLLIK